MSRLFRSCVLLSLLASCQAPKVPARALPPAPVSSAAKAPGPVATDTVTSSTESQFLPALRCVLEHDATCLAKILEDCAGPEALLDPDGGSPLNEAAFSGQLDLMQQLLNYGVSAQQSTTNGWTAMHAAASGGRLDAVKLLLRSGARAEPVWNARYRWRKDFDVGVTPLHLAVEAGSLPVVELLLEHGANINALRRTQTLDRIEGPETTEDRERLRESMPLDLAKPQDGPLATWLVARGGVHGPTFTKADAVFQRGKQKLQAGQPTAALSEFRAALDIDPTHFEAATRQAALLARLAAPTPGGDCQIDWARQARDAIQQLLEIDPMSGKTALAGRELAALARFDFILQVTQGESAFDANVEAFITGKTFRTSCPGSVSCPLRQLTLHRNHRFTNSNDAADSHTTMRNGTGTWQIEGHSLLLRNRQGQLERLPIHSDEQVGNLYWPDPNDTSDEPRRDREGCAL